MKLIPDEILHLYILNPELIEEDTLKKIKEYLSSDISLIVLMKSRNFTLPIIRMLF